jgi:hypothetical protein
MENYETNEAIVSNTPPLMVTPTKPVMLKSEIEPPVAFDEPSSLITPTRPVIETSLSIQMSESVEFTEETIADSTTESEITESKTKIMITEEIGLTCSEEVTFKEEKESTNAPTENIECESVES